MSSTRASTSQRESAPNFSASGSPAHKAALRGSSTPAGGGGAAGSSTLVSSAVFDCSMMPPTNSLSGSLVPRVLQKGRRRRLLSIEVHRVHATVGQHTQKKSSAGHGAAVSDGVYEECVLRVFVPVSTEEKRAAKKRAKAKRRAEREGATASQVAAIEDVEVSLLEDADDDESTVNISPEFMDTGAEVRISEHGADGGTTEKMKAKYRFPIKAIRIKSTHKKSVMVEATLGKKAETREIIFDTTEDSEKFQAIIEQQRNLEKERAVQKMKVAMGDEKSIRLDERLTFLVEIVSGWDLPAGDFTSSDPFVSCLIDGEEVHRTEYISKTLDPIWTVTTGSLFLLKIDVKKLFRGEGLLCVVYDYDKLGGNERLGAITIPPKTIYHANGERMEFKLGPPPGKANDVPGYLAVRIRRATKNDIDFMTKREEAGRMFASKKALGGHVDSHKGGSGNIKSMLTRRSRIAKTGPNAGKKEYRIRPGPDPTRVEETAYMTKEQLEAECLKESTQWVDAGSGRLGRVFVEIIGCDDLPNLDTGGFAGNKTDAFVSLVFEDAFTQTDIIDDTLAPRWMPWTKRAFIFHMMHSSSQLFLGVFDNDDGINPADDHDLVGRVSVDISNLRKDTLYTLKYNLYTTARMSSRKRKGSITLRLRIEIADERKLLLSAIEPPPSMYVNTKTRKEFRVVRFTCTGKYNMEKYSMKTINSYIEELLYLQHVMFYLQDGAMTLLLWRGTMQIPIPFKEEVFLFPIHSLSAFLIMTLLVEHPHWIPSFFFASVAWLMLASQAYRRSLPELWSRCKSYKEFVETLVVGESGEPPDSIEAYENYDDAKAFLDRWQKRIEDAETAASKAYEEQIKAQEEYEREMEEIGDTQDTDIATKTGGGVSIDPFKSLLFPVQQNLALICRYVRHVKYVLSWQECYIAFWVTTGCILLSIICMFVPWFFFIKWTTRLVVWALFGPWMKLVDVYYVSKIKPLTEEEMQEKKEKEHQARLLETMTAVAGARIKREDQAKLKAMKKYMFGRYITRVPVLKEDRYRDLPLPESTAEPFRPPPVPMSELAMADAGYKKIRLPGQHLVGVMIPRIETAGFTEAPIGQPTAYPALVDKNQPGGSISAGSDTTAAAYIRLGSLVVSAAVLTWFGVPLLASLTQHLLSTVQQYTH